MVLPVRVLFKAIGAAPIMKENLFKITASNSFQAVISFLRKELRFRADQPLVSVLLVLLSPRTIIRQLTRTWVQFTYINFSFSPAPDDTVSNLFKAYDSPLLWDDVIC